jgi:hypothetical protein
LFLVHILTLLLSLLLGLASAIVAMRNLLPSYASRNVSQDGLQQVVPNKAMASIYQEFVLEESSILVGMGFLTRLFTQDKLFDDCVYGLEK